MTVMQMLLAAMIPPFILLLIVGAVIWAITGNNAFFQIAYESIKKNRVLKSHLFQAALVFVLIALYAAQEREVVVKEIIAANAEIFAKCKMKQSYDSEYGESKYASLKKLVICVSDENNELAKKIAKDKRELASDACKEADTARMDKITNEFLSSLNLYTSLSKTVENLEKRNLTYTELHPNFDWEKTISILVSVNTQCESEYSLNLYIEFPLPRNVSSLIQRIQMHILYPPTNSQRTPSEKMTIFSDTEQMGTISDFKLMRESEERQRIAEQNRMERQRIAEQNRIVSERMKAEEDAKRYAEQERQIIQRRKIDEAVQQVKITNFTFSCNLASLYPGQCKSPLTLKLMIKNESTMTINKLSFGYAIFPPNEKCPTIITTKTTVPQSYNRLSIDPGEVRSIEFTSEGFAESQLLNPPSACVRLTDAQFVLQ